MIADTDEVPDADPNADVYSDYDIWNTCSIRTGALKVKFNLCVLISWSAIIRENVFMQNPSWQVAINFTMNFNS